MKRLAMLVIGDEILAGHTQDTNSHWLAKRCKRLGIALRRIETCTDDLPDVEASIRRMFALDVDYIVTSGGLGPTPDDRTMEGLARALDTDLELTDANWQWMVERVRFGHERGYFKHAEPNDGMRKMALLPRGAEAMPNGLGTCLGAIVRHDDRLLFTLPGVPTEFERMFDESVVPLLEVSDPPHVAEQRLYTEESRFYKVLEDLEKRFPEVAIGSYPQRGSILIRATGPEAAAEAVIAAVRDAGAEYIRS